MEERARASLRRLVGTEQPSTSIDISDAIRAGRRIIRLRRYGVVTTALAVVAVAAILIGGTSMINRAPYDGGDTPVAAQTWPSTSSTSPTGAATGATASNGATPNTPVPSVHLSATPATILPGQSANLSWTVTAATSCDGKSTDGRWTGSKPTAGSALVQPTATTTYVLTCIGPSGRRAATATVNVNQAHGLTTIEAEAANNRHGGIRPLSSSTAGATGNAFVGWSENGDYLAFDGVDLTGIASIQLRVATPLDGSSIEVRSGTASGPLLATVGLPNTGGWASPNSWQVVTTLLTGVTGRQTVYLILRNPGGTGVADIDWIALSRATSRFLEAETAASYPTLNANRGIEAGRPRRSSCRPASSCVTIQGHDRRTGRQQLTRHDAEHLAAGPAEM